MEKLNVIKADCGHEVPPLKIFRTINGSMICDACYSEAEQKAIKERNFVLASKNRGW